MTSLIGLYLKDHTEYHLFIVIKNSSMKSTFTLSTHVVEKHLDAYNLSDSVFFSNSIMYSAIQKCLNKPDTEKQRGKRFELTKTLNFDIGLLGFTNEPSNKIKVVFTKTKRITFVITAYPIA